MYIPRYFILFTFPLIAMAVEPVPFESLDTVSRAAIAAVFRPEGSKFDIIKENWFDEKKAEESVNKLNGQMIQYGDSLKNEFGEPRASKMKLIGSKSLPNIISIVYFVDASKYPIPVTLVWLLKDDSYKLRGIKWGSQCNQDLSDLCQKNPQEIKVFK